MQTAFSKLCQKTYHELFHGMNRGLLQILTQAAVPCCAALLFAIAPPITALPTTASAEPIYKSHSPRGSTVYTNKQKSSDDERVELPVISRERTPAPISTPYEPPPSPYCGRRGGVDCELGADRDGSVICADGYRDAAASFQVICKTAQLTVTLSGIHASPEGSGAKVIYIAARNSSQGAAEEVSIKVNLGRGTIVNARGPSRIEGFGTELYSLEELTTAAMNRTIRDAFPVTLTCRSCPSPIETSILRKDIERLLREKAITDR